MIVKKGKNVFRKTVQNALNCETEFSVCFQQVDAVLRASTSIVNSAKLKKLFKVKIFFSGLQTQTNIP